MKQIIRVFALLGDHTLRRRLQQEWRGNGLVVCGMHAEGGDSILEELGRIRPHVALVDPDVAGARELIEAASVRYRLPVIALVRNQVEGLAALRPLDWGAVSVVPSPSLETNDSLVELESRIQATGEAQVIDVLETHFPLSGAFPDASVFDLRRALQGLEPAAKVIVVVAGVGGPMAMRRILTTLHNETVSPIVYVQNMSSVFLPALAPWLEHHTGAEVQRAVSGPLEVGQVYVASGNHKITIEARNGVPALQYVEHPETSSTHFDPLLESVARTYAERAVAIVLSGHGQDGAHGLVAVRRAGGFTMVQDRASSLVYDAPGQARDGGGAIECLPINEIAERIQMLMRPEPATSA